MNLVENPDLISTLAEWRGAWAQPWDYTTSHGTLRIKIARRGADPCVVLLLKDCGQIAFAPSWDGFDPSIETSQGARGVRYRIRDSGYLDVECGAVHLSQQFHSYADIPKRPFEIL